MKLIELWKNTQVDASPPTRGAWIETVSPSMARLIR